MSEAITGNKILSHLDRVYGEQRPITADVFLNNYCNNSCGFCTYRRWEHSEGARSIAFDDFVTYATRMKELGVLGIILTGGGEPTIARDFDKITHWLEYSGIKYGINTNFNRYVECNPEYLKVALDAWDEESYELVRGVRAYEQVRDNIKRFAEYKTDSTKLGIQLIARSPEETQKFYDANKDLPVDYIVMRPMESTYGRYYKYEDRVPKFTIRAIKDIAENDARVIVNYKWDMLDKGFDKCLGQWSQIAVNELGEVMYCCHKPYQIIGHIMDDDILEKKRKAETDMKMCDVPCRLSGVNFDIDKLFTSTKAVNAEFI